VWRVVSRRSRRASHSLSDIDGDQVRPNISIISGNQVRCASPEAIGILCRSTSCSTHEMVQAVYRSRFPIVRPWVLLGRLPICVQHPHLAHGPIHRVNALQADIACPTTTKIVQRGHRSPQTKRYFSHTHLAGQRWLIQRRVMHRDERTKMALVSKLVQMIIVTLESVEHAVAQCVSIVSSLYRETAPHTPQGDVEESGAILQGVL